MYAVTKVLYCHVVHYEYHHCPVKHEKIKIRKNRTDIVRDCWFIYLLYMYIKHFRLIIDINEKSLYL